MESPHVLEVSVKYMYVASPMYVHDGAPAFKALELQKGPLLY